MKNLLLLTLFFLATTQLVAQEDLMDLLEQERETETVPVIATFKTTRVVNLHSVEQQVAGVLDFRISHRFGQLNTGAYEFFGLDRATIRLGLEYGVNDFLMLGVGRSSLEKNYDGYLKTRVFQQSTGGKIVPVTVNWFSSISVQTLRWAVPDRENLFSSRLYYTHQLIVGRKFNDAFSFQLSPTLVHRNLVETIADENDVFALGAGGRYSLTRSTTFNAEYIWLLPGETANNHSNSLSLGVDIETGGHVFQLHFTNSPGMVERMFVAENTGEWGRGDIHFGFNISRVFRIKR